MTKAIDLTGQRFGRLTAESRVGSQNGCALWLCRCDCGKSVKVQTRRLRSGNTKSCGCIHREGLSARNRQSKVHGGCANGKEERLYGVWHAMIQRCYDKQRKDYPNYGGRGVSVCTEWRISYAVFRDWALANGYDPQAPYMTCTLDRVDVNKGYCPENCRWVDMKTQANNRRKRKK